MSDRKNRTGINDDRLRRRGAGSSVVIRRLEEEWSDLAVSPVLRQRLAVWGASNPILRFGDGFELVAAARARDVSDWSDRDRVLAGVLKRFDSDPLARRIALQVMLPQVKAIVDDLAGWDLEERAARVVAETIEVLALCASRDADTPLNFRVFANTRRRVVRDLLRSRSDRSIPFGDMADVEDPGVAVEKSGLGVGSEELVEWLAGKGGVSEKTARLVVLTRTNEVSIGELAWMQGVDPATLRQRRLRAERQLRQGMGLSR